MHQASKQAPKQYDKQIERSISHSNTLSQSLSSATSSSRQYISCLPPHFIPLLTTKPKTRQQQHKNTKSCVRVLAKNVFGFVVFVYVCCALCCKRAAFFSHINLNIIHKSAAPRRVRSQSASDLSRRKAGELSHRPDVDEARENYPHYR